MAAYAAIYKTKRKRGERMKKIMMILALFALPVTLSACMKKCETEPIVTENHKLIVPPNFGQMPK